MILMHYVFVLDIHWTLNTCWSIYDIFYWLITTLHLGKNYTSNAG